MSNIKKEDSNMKNKELEVLQGEKVLLRPIRWDDTEYIVKWRNNPNVRNNFIFREKFTNVMHENWMKTKVETGEVVQYIIEDLTNGQPVGSVYFRDIDEENDSAEYGIFIGEDSVRGKGMGTETAKLFVKFGLEKLGLHRIFLRVLRDNQTAYKSYEKAGFQKEGIFRDMVKLDDKYVDIIFMAVIGE